jgi:hypothetical protein
VQVDLENAAATVDERFLSVAVDIANVVGGRFWDRRKGADVMGTEPVPAYDFARPRLRNLAAGLAPGYLRIGGTDADRTVYDLREPDGPDSSPPNHAQGDGVWVLGRRQWDAVGDFARALDYRILFTLNAGKSARDAGGAWRDEDARQLVSYSRKRQIPVDVWEFGNELNVFPILHGDWLSPAQYAQDIARLRGVVSDLSPGALVAGPAAAFWPTIGEGIPFLRRFMSRGGALVDVVTWHYYPEQSFRCPVATNRARAGELMRPRELDEVDRWASFVESMKDKHGPGATVWLGETGSAQCGGEPGLSDTFASSFWWLDQLGRIARRGQPVIIRQSLSGGDYGLVDDTTLNPNPDYWASLMWKRFMGRRALSIQSDNESPLRLAAHCAPDTAPGFKPGAVTVLAINLHGKQTLQAELPAFARGRAALFPVTASDLGAREVKVSGKVLRANADGVPPQMAPAWEKAGREGRVRVAPRSYTFAVFPDANATACR